MPHPLAPLLPPLARFLLEDVCMPAGPVGAGAGPPGDAAELAGQATSQGIAGLLHQWACAHPGAPVAEPLRRQLAAGLQANVLHALKQAHDTVQMVKRLRDAGIEALVLKGPLLSRRYYGDLGVRGAGDVDLLVDESQAVRADRLLRESGCERLKPRQALAGRRLELYLDTQHEFGYRLGPTPVELHWRYADSHGLFATPFSELWARAEASPLAGTNLRLLSPTDTFLQLAIHGYTDGWSRLKWIADLPRVLDRLTADELRGLVTMAESKGLSRIVNLALALAGRPYSAGAWLEPVLAYIATRLLSPHPRTLSGAQRRQHAIQAQRYSFAVLPDWKLRRSALYCKLIMPADFDHLPLPDALTPLLPYLAQFRRLVAYRPGRN